LQAELFAFQPLKGFGGIVNKDVLIINMIAGKQASKGGGKAYGKLCFIC
jgi:hypothetical protein